MTFDRPWGEKWGPNSPMQANSPMKPHQGSLERRQCRSPLLIQVPSHTQASRQLVGSVHRAAPKMLCTSARPQLAASFRPIAARNVQQLSRARAPLRLYASAEQQEERSLAQK